MSRYMDMLVKLGVGNAHPGGFSSTIEQFEHFPIEAGVHVLEVGCGTGRTACYLAAKGCKITGVDIRSAMIKKARERAKAEKVRVDFRVADARHLPFDDATFDVVLVESVSVFAGIPDCFAEYARVLGKGGTLYDREIVGDPAISDELMNQVQQFYGIAQLPNVDEWLQAIRPFFEKVSLWKPSVFSEEMWKSEHMYPDLSQPVDVGAYSDTELQDITRQYEQLMYGHAHLFGYGLFVATK